MGPDFGGYATKTNIRCSDGRTILPGAFKHQDKARVPLVWQHQHNDPKNVIGHAILHERGDGTYAENYLNKTEQADAVRELLIHGDVECLSIYANGLQEKGKSVAHGTIREVSVVLAGANPGAVIDFVALAHGEGNSDEALIYSGLSIDLDLESEEESEGELEHASTKEDMTVQDVFDSMTEEQQNILFYLLGEALAENDKSGTAAQSATTDDPNITHSQEGTGMARNVFDQSEQNGATGPVLTHDQISTLFAEAKKNGSLKDTILVHAQEYGIENLDVLLPEAKLVNGIQRIKPEDEWVPEVMNAITRSPFSRVKTIWGDITFDEARARGYIKATEKKEGYYSLTKRETTPKTIYIKQKIDRDDVIDVVDFDIVAWMMENMNIRFREEIALAILLGDGREVDDPYKINETNVRPIITDDEFFTDQVEVPAGVSGEALIEAVLRARPAYKGSGSPKLFMEEGLAIDLLLIRDRNRRRIYRTLDELAAEMRVSKIVPCPALALREVDGKPILAVLVNLSDYTVGADRGGDVTSFEDFDIDFNQYTYLKETRISGALTRRKSAQVFTRETGAVLATPTVPTFVSATGVITIPSVTGVIYRDAADDSVLSAGALDALAAGETMEVEAVPATGYYFPHNFDADWVFTRPAA